MAREHDEQLLEQVGVRRRRLLDAVLWGRDRTRLAVPDNVARFFAGLVVAALVSAGCVGWSFASALLERARADQQAPAAVSTPR